MRIAARALPAPLWLVWLSLLVALLPAGLTAGVRAPTDAGARMARASAVNRGDVVPARTLTSDDDTGNQDELSSNSALPSQAAWTPRHDVAHLRRGQSDRGECGSPTTLLSPRAPPVFVSL